MVANTRSSAPARNGRPAQPYEDRCDRCGGRIDSGFAERLGIERPRGFVWVAYGGKVVLCSDCKEDLEESVASYGENARKQRSRFLARVKEFSGGQTKSKSGGDTSRTR